MAHSWWHKGPIGDFVSTVGGGFNDYVAAPTMGAVSSLGDVPWGDIISGAGNAGLGQPRLANQAVNQQWRDGNTGLNLGDIIGLIDTPRTSIAPEQQGRTLQDILEAVVSVADRPRANIVSSIVDDPINKLRRRTPMPRMGGGDARLSRMGRQAPRADGKAPMGGGDARLMRGSTAPAASPPPSPMSEDQQRNARRAANAIAARNHYNRSWAAGPSYRGGY